MFYDGALCGITLYGQRSFMEVLGSYADTAPLLMVPQQSHKSTYYDQAPRSLYVAHCQGHSRFISWHLPPYPWPACHPHARLGIAEMCTSVTGTSFLASSNSCRCVSWILLYLGIFASLSARLRGAD